MASGITTFRMDRLHPWSLKRKSACRGSYLSRNHFCCTEDLCPAQTSLSFSRKTTFSQIWLWLARHLGLTQSQHLVGPINNCWINESKGGALACLVQTLYVPMVIREWTIQRSGGEKRRTHLQGKSLKNIHYSCRKHLLSAWCCLQP